MLAIKHSTLSHVHTLKSYITMGVFALRAKRKETSLAAATSLNEQIYEPAVEKKENASYNNSK